jgi:RecA/RadA recombinase
MASLAIERLEIALQAKKFDHTLAKPWTPAALSSERDRRVMSTGIATLDGALGGGWERGEVSELVGGRSTGRLSVLCSTLAGATHRGEVTALVDALDRFDPASAAAAGVDLERVLWVRGSPVSVPAARPPGSDGLSEVVNRAVRALDLIVRAGGFGVVALDVADVPSRWLRALPLATWMRIARVNEGRDTVCLLVGETPMGRSARGVSVRLSATGRWMGASAQSRRFVGVDARAEIMSARGNLKSF